tara:strand:- start:69709 stop:72018 length:2310 start_codon:yes stop_codon:yes gene_type:complete
MKYIATLVLLFTIISSAKAQNFEESWEGHFSYVSIKAISQGNDRVYAASENALFTYDLSTQEINTISSINGLAGEAITTIYYSENYDLLVIGYENGLIEVVTDGEDNVLSVVDILEKPTIPPDQKGINHFNEYDGNLYIATQFGISVYDLAALEFGDTYFIGDLGAQIDVLQTTVRPPHIFAVSPNDGVFRALVEDDNLIDYQNWTKLTSAGYKGIQTLQDEVYALNNGNIVFEVPISGAFIQRGGFGANVVDFKSAHNLLTITTTNSIQSYSNGFVLEANVSNSSIPEFDFELQAGYAFNDVLYLGTSSFGMLLVPFGTNQATQVLPDGPVLNQSFAIDATPGLLWTVFGDFSVTFNPYPLSYRGISNYREGSWTNLSYDELEDIVGKPINDLVDVTINPNNPEETYISSYQKGLLKINGQDPEILYDQTNTIMEIPPVGSPEAVGIRLYGSAYDREGNLWVVQSRSNEGLIKVSPEGQFTTIDVSNIINGEQEQAFTKLAISREGYVFFGTSTGGLIGYNPATGAFNRIEEGVGNGDIPRNSVRSLAFDNQNRLWIGTTRGLRVLFNVGGFFEENANIDAQPIIILEDGVPQELLFELFITEIEVDGSNNKWISTATSGVFYLSSNGQETLLRFTKANSPLPSNNVQDIAIDSFTGTVYFATVNGLVAYKGTATAPRDNLENVYAFPNPVRPGFTGNVTIDGLTADANVKITDIEGNLVFEQTSEGGSVLWDTTAFGKYSVASGVYLVLITTEDNLETKVTKIMIVR